MVADVRRALQLGPLVLSCGVPHRICPPGKSQGPRIRAGGRAPGGRAPGQGVFLAVFYGLCVCLFIEVIVVLIDLN